jgi:predicted MFS family arabinose efflux permease
MQAQNTLNYSVQKQHNNNALYVVFSFSRVLNALTQSYTVTQRIAHAVATAQHNATTAQIAAIVAAQAKHDNAAAVRDYTSSAVCKQLARNDLEAL